LRAQRLMLVLLAMASGLVVTATTASAHPHVWVTMQTTVLYDKGTITGLQHAWTFDEMYTQQAIEGLDKNGDGKYDRQELQELAQVNIDGLKEFAYFTYAKLGDKALTFKPPVDYWLDYTDKGILTLHFTLPLEKPIPADAPGFNFAIFDSSFFIAFDFAEKDPVKLGANAPHGCKAAIHEPGEDDDAKKLNDAFSGAMSGGGSVSIGSGGGKTVAIECAKS
jgi:ABC-type uncharacterized transport system substrate-binding protein